MSSGKNKKVARQTGIMSAPHSDSVLSIQDRQQQRLSYKLPSEWFRFHTLRNCFVFIPIETASTYPTSRFLSVVGHTTIAENRMFP